MESIKKTENVVKHILETQPETRNNDDLLFAKICEYLNKESLFLPFCTVLTNRKSLGLPSFKTVERNRRKLQEAFPELRASDTIEDFRDIQEDLYKNYGKSVI